MASLESRITQANETSMEDAEAGQNAQKTTGENNNESNLIENEFEVQIKPIDASSPLFSVKSFDELGL